jgi:hypothetical protein
MKITDNREVAHLWAHGEVAKSHNGQFYSEPGGTLWSYGAHHCVAILLHDNTGAFVIYERHSPSITTSKHHSFASQASCHLPSLSMNGLNRIARMLADDQRADYRESIMRVLEETDNLDPTADPEVLQRILWLIGSRANASRLKDKLAKARTQRRASDEKATAKRYLQLARNALGFKIADYVKPRGSDTVRAVGLRDLHASNWTHACTQMARAWKFAKAAGWSEKRLKALRTREKTLRADIARSERRTQQAGFRASMRRVIAELRQHLGGRSVREAMHHSSIHARVTIADHLASLSHITRVMGRGLPGLGGSRDAAHATLMAALDMGNEAKELNRHVKTQAREALQAAQLAEWKAGRGPSSFYTMNEVHLRAVHVTRDEVGEITGGELQTSQGARVPLVRAVRVFRFCKYFRARALALGKHDNDEMWKRNGQTIRVGPYQLDTIYGDGSFKAGCHFIRWPQIAELAQSLGVFELSPVSKPD